jgi:uncharacterized membrane protein YsdA (DUF1294 family)
MQKIILLYFILINVASFVLYTFDKYKSRVGGRRTSEKNLFLSSLLGGFIGASLSMILFRHKIKKKSFIFKHILIVLLWILTLYFYFFEVNELNFLR